jgi:hypothetical protein
MAFLKKFSLNSLVERFGQSFRRFPLAMLFTLFLTGFLIYQNHGGDVGSRMEFFLMFYLATGAMLAVALSLLTEDFKRWPVALAFQAVVHAVWLGVSIYLSKFDHFSLPQWIAVTATVFAIGLAIFLICFYRRHQDLQFWNFSIRTVMALTVTIAIGGVLALGLFALIGSLRMLFGLEIKHNIEPDIAILCMVFLAPTLFMNLIPKGKEKFLNEAPEFSHFAKGVVQYLFLPLLGLYMITLYAYAAMILMQWTLPVGGVSYLVTGSMVLMVLLLYVSYPVQHLEGNRLFKCVTRWLPVVMLPLLALMTVAIARRLSDYGITVSRLYLLVFNVWCYAVCLWLIFTRNKRIWLIPASFAVILLLISVGPQSIANVTQRQLKKEAQTAFAGSGVKQFPLTGEQYEQWLNRVDPKVARSIDAKLNYLDEFYGYDYVSDLLAKDVITGRFSSIDEDGYIVSANNDTFSNNDLVKNMAVPQGYHAMTVVHGDDDNVFKMNEDKLWLKINDGNDVEHRFELDIKQLSERDVDRNADEDVQPLVIDNGESVLVINDYYITVYIQGSRHLNFSGILFTK